MWYMLSIVTVFTVTSVPIICPSLPISLSSAISLVFSISFVSKAYIWLAMCYILIKLNGNFQCALLDLSLLLSSLEIFFYHLYVSYGTSIGFGFYFQVEVLCILSSSKRSCRVFDHSTNVSTLCCSGSWTDFSEYNYNFWQDKIALHHLHTCNGHFF